MVYVDINELRAVSKSIFCTDRYVVVRDEKLLICNIYLPCLVTADHINFVDDYFTGSLVMAVKIPGLYDHYWW